MDHILDTCFCKRAGSGELSQQPLHFLRGENDGHPDGTLGTCNVVEPGQWLVENITVEKEQGRQCLVLGRGCHLARASQVGEEGTNVGGPELRWVLFMVEENILFNPGEVRVFGAWAVVAQA